MISSAEEINSQADVLTERGRKQHTGKDARAPDKVNSLIGHDDGPQGVGGEDMCCKVVSSRAAIFERSDTHHLTGESQLELKITAMEGRFELRGMLLTGLNSICHIITTFPQSKKWACDLLLSLDPVDLSISVTILLTHHKVFFVLESKHSFALLQERF